MCFEEKSRGLPPVSLEGDKAACNGNKQDLPLGRVCVCVCVCERAHPDSVTTDGQVTELKC